MSAGEVVSPDQLTCRSVSGSIDRPVACNLACSDPLTCRSMSGLVGRPASPTNWLSMALASAVGLHDTRSGGSFGVGQSQGSDSAGSSPLADDSSSGGDNTCGGGGVLMVQGAECTSRHGSDSGNSSTNSRDVSVYGSPSCLSLTVGPPVLPVSVSRSITSASIITSTAASALAVSDPVSSHLAYSATAPTTAPPLASPHHLIAVSSSPSLLLPASGGALPSPDPAEKRPCYLTSSDEASRRTAFLLDATAGTKWASRCPLHRQCELTMLCNTCQLPLCYTCALQHASHSLELLSHTDTVSALTAAATPSTATALSVGTAVSAGGADVTSLLHGSGSGSVSALSLAPGSGSVDALSMVPNSGPGSMGALSIVSGSGSRSVGALSMAHVSGLSSVDTFSMVPGFGGALSMLPGSGSGLGGAPSMTPGSIGALSITLGSGGSLSMVPCSGSGSNGAFSTLPGSSSALSLTPGSGSGGALSMTPGSSGALSIAHGSGGTLSMKSGPGGALSMAPGSVGALPISSGSSSGVSCRRALLGRSSSVQQQAGTLLRAVASAQQRAADVGAALRQRAARARLEAAAVCDQLRAALATSQQRLERKATTVCQLKLSRLQQQCERLEQLRMRILQLLEETQLSDSSGVESGCTGSLVESDSDAERLLRCVIADQQLRGWMTSALLSPVEDATLRYVAASGESATAAIALACGRLESSGCAEQSRLTHYSIGTPLVVGRLWHAMLSVRDHYGDERQAPAADAVEMQVTTSDGRSLACHVQQLSASDYRLSCVPPQVGVYRFAVTVNGLPVLVEGAAVWSQRAVAPRPLATVGPAPRLVVGGGGESSAPGRFCRPWGVAFSSVAATTAAAGCDTSVAAVQQQQQLLAVSDRSNHRVQVFAVDDGRLLFTFGQLGQRCGELNRPAGLAFTANGAQLVVADKDNHRVQVFTCDGRFIFKFGEKGSRPGMFNYPWDVACNCHGQIAVSDTRNHRVQLFTADGVLLKKFSQDGADWKELDSPRGLAFHPDGRLFITDFNNHRVVALHIATGHMGFIGREGSEPCRFLRPQGIAVDDEGRLYVSDCRNSRIQVVTPSGECLLQLGGQPGSAPGQFDQPQGVAVSSGSGLLAVVCLENHRVQLF